MSNKHYKISNEKLIHAVANSTSLRQCLILLGINCKGGGNYKTYKFRIKKLNIDVSHWTGKVHNKGKTYLPDPIILQEQLSIESTICSGH